MEKIFSKLCRGTLKLSRGPQCAAAHRLPNTPLRTKAESGRDGKKDGRHVLIHWRHFNGFICSINNIVNRLHPLVDCVEVILV